MPTIADRVSELATIAPFAKAAAWDPVGLQFGDTAASGERLAVCHDVTDDVVAYLETTRVDLLVAYHPLLFRPTTSLVSGAGASGRAFRLIRANVALAVVHTAYDVQVGGTADSLADELELDDVTGFGPLRGEDSVKITTDVPRSAAGDLAEALSSAGADVRITCRLRHSRPAIDGFDGESLVPTATGDERVEMLVPAGSVDIVLAALIAGHPEAEPDFDAVEVRVTAGFVGRVGRIRPCSLSDLVAVVSSRLGGVVRVAPAGPHEDKVARIAVVPGSGGSLIAAAAASGADVLVTGDVGHHEARDAIDKGLSIVDAGHAATERPGVARLYAAVSALGTTEDLTSLGGGPWEEPS